MNSDLMVCGYCGARCHTAETFDEHCRIVHPEAYWGTDE